MRQLTVMLSACVAAGTMPLAAVMVAVTVPAAVGVQVMAPLVVSIVMPAGAPLSEKVGAG